ncbi:hypothetical protein VPH35_070224 [Triticum aestivum]
MEAETETEGSMERNTKPTLNSHPGATSNLFMDDLILEIFSRLPARSLHRFKCVSVSWRDLITDPANRNKLPQTLAGFLYFTTDGSGHRHHFASVSGAAAPLDPCLQPNKYKYMVQLGSCNGLLLYRGCDKRMANWAGGASRFVVCNPATRRWVELPPQPQVPANKYCHIAGAWSRKDVALVEKVALFFCSKCVFVGGMMYVIGNPRYINEYVMVVVGVNMEGKVWETIRVPYGSRFGTIGSSQGCLHYAIASVDDNNNIILSEIELWCLKDRDSKELLMSMTGKKYLVAEFHPDCDTIFLVSSGGDTLVAYVMRHQKVGCIINLEKSNTQQFLPYVPLFAESLPDADGQ